VEESIGGRVSQEEASVQYAEAEPSETAANLTTALGEGGCRFFQDIQDLAALGNFR
jgi:hypothetical protein